MAASRVAESGLGQSRSLGRTLLILTSVVVSLVFAAPVAQADPAPFPGTGSTSGSSSTPPVGGGSGNHSYNVGAERVKLKNFPSGTRLSQKLASGYCLDEADDTGFSTVTGPFYDCTYRNAYAQYDYAITLPDGRVLQTRLEWTKPFAKALRARCVWFLGGCEVGKDGNDQALVNLFVPNVPVDALDSYCTAEGYSCNVDNRNAFTMYYRSIQNPSKLTKKEFPRRSAGTESLTFECKASSFGNVDPDPGVRKACLLGK